MWPLSFREHRHRPLTKVLEDICRVIQGLHHTYLTHRFGRLVEAGASYSFRTGLTCPLPQILELDQHFIAVQPNLFIPTIDITTKFVIAQDEAD